MKRTIIVLLLILSSCSLHLAKRTPVSLGDMVYLNDGEEYHCYVREVNARWVVFETEEGTKRLPLSKVRSIDIQKRRKNYWWTNVEDIDDPVLIGALKTDLSQFKGLGYVNILTEKKLIVNPDSTYTVVIREIRGIVDDKGRTAGNLSYYYKHNNENLFIDFARTITSDGKVLHIREMAIEDASSYARFPSYDNLHSRKFAMREVKPGNFLDYRVRIEGKYSEDLPPLFDEILGDMGPTLKGKILIQYPEEMEISVRYDRILAPELTRKEDNDISYEVMSFEMETVSPIIKLPMKPPERFFSPRVVAGFKNEWGGISDWFDTNLKSSGTKIEGKTKEEIYENVLKGIKFVNIPSNTYSVIPKNPTETFNNRYGNSLDKTFVLYTALKENGFKPDLILVRSKDSGPLAEDVPTLSQFDGALVRCDGVFLDPSVESVPFGYVRPEYQGTRGLSIGTGEIVEIPFLEPEDEMSYTDRNIYLSEDGSGKVEEVLTFTGNDVLFFRNWKYLREEERRKQLESHINLVLPNASLKGYHIEHLEDLNPEMQITLDYTAPDIATEEGRYMLLHIPGINYTAYYVGVEQRPYPVYNENLSLNKNRIRIYLPKGYRVRYIPTAINYDSEPIKFTSKIKKTKKYIEYSDSYDTRMGLIPLENYPEYREGIMKMAEIPNRWIILEK
ncbi:hypothetical protein CH333_03665 [candidate division WOR-3 bacterium JGI_Cruoil_03_44_89]|uniref:DUF3857 domain-containing protein n=1 Tax=candidate division WOR-3 bacterium JGI_Cruoil_03_44_89 TaxID=1973748 RepID=A0A235BW72_UNCW3|nr:MAG: hypothetical protein CH333_03665 [candidate division WOR-3 bacterium JGI_Cruoil_03_44_89]